MNNSKKVLIILLVVFVGISAFLALKLERGIIPDERGYHFPVSKLYATTWGIPADTPETYQFRGLGHRPFLYHWINGRILNSAQAILPDLSDWRKLVLLRLTSVFYSLGTLYFTYKLAGEFIHNKWGQVFVVFLLTNTLMFVFISSGVNYDNLVNFCCAAGLYFLTRAIKGGDFYQNSFAWISCIAFGTLVKSTVLPVAAIMVLVWAVYTVINRKIINFKIFPNFQFFLTAFFLIVLLIGNLAIYGVNIVNYGSIKPDCDQILTQEQCENSAIYVRSQKIDSAKNSITIKDVVEGEGPDPISYFSDYWVPAMSKMIFGITGHKRFNPPDLMISLYRLIILVTILSAFKFWKTPSYPLGSLYAVFAFYTLVLFTTNYQTEMWSGFAHIAVQGRYIFPVIGIIYILMTYFLLIIPNTFVRRGVFSFTVFLFLLNSPIVFLTRPSPVTLPERSIPREEPMGEITDQVTIAQEFVSECHGTITETKLLLATYRRINTHPVLVRLIDMTNNRIIAEHSFSAQSVADNSWYSISIPPLSGSLGKIYQIIVSSPESVSGNAITIWGSENGNHYPDGHALVNGKRIGSDLNFQYECNQPAITDWFVN